jgi:hypothetical protein
MPQKLRVVIDFTPNPDIFDPKDQTMERMGEWFVGDFQETESFDEVREDDPNALIYYEIVEE